MLAGSSRDRDDEPLITLRRERHIVTLADQEHGSPLGCLAMLCLQRVPIERGAVRSGLFGRYRQAVEFKLPLHGGGVAVPQTVGRFLERVGNSALVARSDPFPRWSGVQNLLCVTVMAVGAPQFTGRRDGPGVAHWGANSMAARPRLRPGGGRVVPRGAGDHAVLSRVVASSSGFTART
jgi:hypothetical protein